MKSKYILAVMKKYGKEIMFGGLATVTLGVGGVTLAKRLNQVEPILPGQTSNRGVVVVPPKGEPLIVPEKGTAAYQAYVDEQVAAALGESVKRTGEEATPVLESDISKTFANPASDGKGQKAPVAGEEGYIISGPRPTPPWKGEAADGKEPKTPPQGTPESDADIFKPIQDFVQKQIEERQRREDIDQGLFPHGGRPRAIINPDTGKPIENLCEIDGSCNTPMEGSAVVNRAVDEAVTAYQVDQILGRKPAPAQAVIDSPAEDTILMEPTSENFCGKSICPVTVKTPKSESSAKYVRVGSRKGRPVYKRVPKAAADNLCKSVVAKKLDETSSLYLADFQPRVSEAMAFADQQMQGVAGLVAPPGRKGGVGMGRRVDVEYGH